MWDEIGQAVSATRTSAQNKNCYLYLGIASSESGSNLDRVPQLTGTFRQKSYLSQLLKASFEALYTSDMRGLLSPPCDNIQCRI